jgi:hypothetical protein
MFLSYFVDSDDGNGRLDEWLLIWRLKRSIDDHVVLTLSTRSF